MERHAHQAKAIRATVVGCSRNGLAVHVQSYGLEAVRRAEDNGKTASRTGCRKAGQTDWRNHLYRERGKAEYQRDKVYSATDKAISIASHGRNVPIRDRKRNAKPNPSRVPSPPAPRAFS